MFHRAPYYEPGKGGKKEMTADCVLLTLLRG
jgi:hypothetical protein